ncbi:MAG: potassium channel protein, partial [Acidobacteriota bacterium]
MAKPTDEERNETLEQLDDWIETPMAVLGFVWLLLLAIDLTRGLTSFLETLTTIIWATFVLEFALKLTLAPKKLVFLRHNWLVVISLIVPAFRALRIFQAVRLLKAARVVRGFRLVRVVGSLN